MIELSIIIPTLNEENHIGIILEKLSQVSEVELIVVDGGSTDRTLEIVSKYPQVKLIKSEKGRSFQMNSGADLASGEILLFLHADTSLPPDFKQHIKKAMNSKSHVGGSFYLEFDIDHPLLRFYSRVSRINHSWFTYGDQAIFIRKNVFQEIGKYSAIPIMEDLEIQKRLRKKGKFVKLDYPVVTSARKFMKEGILWNQLRNTGLVALYVIGFPPKKLSRYY